MKIQGFKRGKGKFGIRNHILVIPSVVCANSIVEKITELDKEVIKITHQHGCDHIGKDKEQVLRTLAGVCNNPNVGGVLLVGLGCENVTIEDINKLIDTDYRIVRKILVQEVGELKKILELAKKYLREIKDFVSKQEKKEFDLNGLIVGLQCGGSDSFSGITANPAIGKVSDKLVQLGSTVILSEVPEMIGAKEVLEKRIPNEEVKKKIFSRIDEYVETAKRFGTDLMGINPTPGNIKTGLSSPQEKSLGALSKSGNSQINEFVPYGKVPKSKGLVIMDTPGNDAESITGEVAGGAQVILFTTGLGTPLGNAITPVIKISSNTKTFKHMNDFIDVNAGKIIDGSTAEDIKEELFKFLIEVCNGSKTASERNGAKEFSINRIGPTF